MFREVEGGSRRWGKGVLCVLVGRDWVVVDSAERDLEGWIVFLVGLTCEVDWKRRLGSIEARRELGTKSGTSDIEA